MSWWTDLRDKYVHFGTLGIVDPAASRQQEREQRDLVNSQIKAYQDQTAMEKAQLDESRAATEAEKRRINEKQIRSLRRTYRTQGAGMLGVGNSASNDMNSKLGS